MTNLKERIQKVFSDILNPLETNRGMQWEELVIIIIIIMGEREGN